MRKQKLRAGSRFHLKASRPRKAMQIGPVENAIAEAMNGNAAWTVITFAGCRLQSADVSGAGHIFTPEKFWDTNGPGKGPVVSRTDRPAPRPGTAHVARSMSDVFRVATVQKGPSVKGGQPSPLSNRQAILSPKDRLFQVEKPLHAPCTQILIVCTPCACGLLARLRELDHENDPPSPPSARFFASRSRVA